MDASAPEATAPRPDPGTPEPGTGVPDPVPNRGAQSLSAPRWLVIASAVAGRLLVVSAGVYAVALALTRLSLAFLPLVLALLLSTLLVPPGRWLKGHGVPPALAALLLVVGAMAAVAGLLVLLAPAVVGQLGELIADVDLGLDALSTGAAEALGLEPDSVAALVDRAVEQLSANAGDIGSGLLSGAFVVFEIVTGLVLALVLTFFFVKDGDRIASWFLARTPATCRATMRVASRRAWETLTSYVRGQAIIAAVDAVAIGAGLLLIGVPLVVPLAVLTFFAGFIPIVGAFTAGLLAVLVALVNGGLTDALLALLVVVGVQQAEGNVLEPLVLGRAVPLHPVVILLAITCGSVLAGVVGAFLAVPIAGVVSAVGNELRLRQEAGSR